MSPTTIALLALSGTLALLILVLVIVVKVYQSKLVAAKAAQPIPMLSIPDYPKDAQAHLAPILAHNAKLVQDAAAKQVALKAEIHAITAQPDPTKRAEDLSALYNRLRAEADKDK